MALCGAKVSGCSFNKTILHMFIIDDLAVGVAGSLIASAIQRGLKSTDKAKYEKVLNSIICKTVKGYEKENSIPDEGEKYAFYKSQLIVNALISQRLFKDFDYKSMENAFRQDDRVIQPRPDQLIQFITLFETFFNENPDAASLGIESQYKGLIFYVADKVDIIDETTKETLRLLQQGGYLKKTKYLSTVPPIDPFEVIGREKELQEISELLEKENKVVLVNGLGGIGKTTVAKLYTELNKDKFDHLVWIDGTNTVPEGILQAKDLLNNLGLTGIDKSDSETIALTALNELRNIEGNNFLIIDNARETIKKYADNLPGKPNWFVLVTSREKLSPFKEYRLDTLKPDEAKKLFRTHFTEECNETELDELLEYIGYHTLTIELLAKTLNESITIKCVSELTEYLKENKLNEINIDVETGHTKEYKNIYSHLINAFKLAGLSGDELLLLKQLSILPSEELAGELVLFLTCEKDNQQNEKTNTLNFLVRKGWIESKKKNVFKVHQIIQEVIRYETKPNINEYETVISAIASLCSLDQSKDNPVEKFIWIPFGASICNYFSEESESLNVLKNNLALRYKDFGNYKKSKVLLEETLASAIKNFGEEHPTTAVSRSNLASVYRDLGEYKKASELLEIALASDIKNFGEEHPSTARSRSNLALVYKALGEYKKASELLEIALASDIKNFGEEHPTTATYMNNLAYVYLSVEKYEEALVLFLKTYKVLKRFVGENHPNTVSTKNTLDQLFSNSSWMDKLDEV